LLDPAEGPEIARKAAAMPAIDASLKKRIAARMRFPPSVFLGAGILPNGWGT